MDTRNINFEDIVNSKKHPAALLTDDVIVLDSEILTSRNILNPEISSPVRINVHAFIICTYGEISVSVNYIPYRLTKGSMLGMSSLHVIDNVQVRNNCQAIGVIVSHNFTMPIIHDTLIAKKMIGILKKRPEPVIKLEEDEMRLLKEIIQRIKNNLKKTDHAFQSVLVRNETSNFLMEVFNIYLQKSGAEIKKDKKESRKNDILRAFMQLMVKQYKEQHEVAYYAAELCMTPDNLSRSVIAVSGKSPLHWINGALVAEAKTLLRKPDANIKEVADELNFGDQSSFGKFFKKHTGMTPMEFRKKG
jgi:AraC-like DNA-binding protein